MKNTPQEIEQGMIEKNIELQRGIEEVPELINKKAGSERDYEVSLAQKTLALKTEGYPATIIRDLAKGNKTIADLKFKHSVATELLKLQYIKIDAAKTKIGSYQSMHALRRIEYQKANIVD